MCPKQENLIERNELKNYKGSKGIDFKEWCIRVLTGSKKQCSKIIDDVGTTLHIQKGAETCPVCLLVVRFVSSISLSEHSYLTMNGSVIAK